VAGTFQAPPHIASLHANDGIFPGGIVRLSPKELYSNEPFLEQITAAIDLLIDDVLEELLAAPTSSEMPTDYDPAQLLSNEVWCNRILLQVWSRLVASIIEDDFFEHAEIIRRDRYWAKRDSVNRNIGLARFLQ
jgi:hypothetical protein